MCSECGGSRRRPTDPPDKHPHRVATVLARIAACGAKIHLDSGQKSVRGDAKFFSACIDHKLVRARLLTRESLTHSLTHSHSLGGAMQVREKRRRSMLAASILLYASRSTGLTSFTSLTSLTHSLHFTLLSFLSFSPRCSRGAAYGEKPAILGVTTNEGRNESTNVDCDNDDILTHSLIHTYKQHIYTHVS